MARLIDKVLGHDDIAKGLVQSVRTKNLASAYIFSGPTGVGKKIIALGVAQELLCEKIPACGICPSCSKIENFQHEEVKFIEPDGLQIKIQQAREILNFLSLQKLGRARIIILNDAHSLNPQSANLLLKTLEDPPADTHFFLITHLEKSILPTIRSRTQIIRFPVLDRKSVKKLTSAADWMITASQGRMDILEQFQDTKHEEVRIFVLEFLEYLNEKFVREPFVKLKERLEDKELALFASLILQQMVRDIYFLKYDLHPLIHADLADRLKVFAEASDEKIMALFQNAFEIERNLFSNTDRNLVFENFLLQNQKILP